MKELGDKNNIVGILKGNYGDYFCNLGIGRF